MVEYLISVGELYSIPAFEYVDEYGNNVKYSETYACKDSVVYDKAIQMGVITE